MSIGLSYQKFLVLACKAQGWHVLSLSLDPIKPAAWLRSLRRHVHAHVGFTAICAALAGTPDDPSLRAQAPVVA